MPSFCLKRTFIRRVSSAALSLDSPFESKEEEEEQGESVCLDWSLWLTEPLCSFCLLISYFIVSRPNPTINSFITFVCFINTWLLSLLTFVFIQCGFEWWWRGTWRWGDRFFINLLSKIITLLLLLPLFITSPVFLTIGSIDCEFSFECHDSSPLIDEIVFWPLSSHPLAIWSFDS